MKAQLFVDPRRAFLIMMLSLTACGMKAQWTEIGDFQCNDGRRIDTKEWTPYVGATSWIENNKTGEQIQLQPPLRCWKEPRQ